MKRNLIQIESVDSEDFKNEIIHGLKNVLNEFVQKLTATSKEIYLTREETAKLLSVSLVTLWDWTRKDILPAYRIGNKVRYKKSEVIIAMQKMNQFNSKSFPHE